MKHSHPLLQIALNQGGLFTSRQALEAGIDPRNHSYHLRAGNWARVNRGIFRLKIVSENSREDLFHFQLWAQSKRGILVGAFSYETAVMLWGLASEKNNTRHLTVPKNFRKISGSAKNLVIHNQNLTSTEVVVRDGLRVTTLPRTFADLVTSKKYSADWVKSLIRESIKRKLTSTEEVRTIKILPDFQRTFDAILYEVFD